MADLLSVDPSALTMLRDLVLIRLHTKQHATLAIARNPIGRRTDGGLEVPVAQGVVVNVGPGVVTRQGAVKPVAVKPGQHVVFPLEVASFMQDSRDGRSLALLPSEYVEAVV